MESTLWSGVGALSWRELSPVRVSPGNVAAKDGDRKNEGVRQQVNREAGEVGPQPQIAQGAWDFLSCHLQDLLEGTQCLKGS